MGAQISNRIAAVEKEIIQKKTAPAECAGMISQLKVELTKLPGMQPGVAANESAVR